MTDIFLSVINMSISAGYLILAVILLRLVLKKAPKWIAVLLWGIVAVRLVCPFSVESILSLIPSAETVSPDIMIEASPSINSGIPIINSAINPIISESFTPAAGDSVNPLQIVVPILAFVWIVGMTALVLYTLISYLRIKGKINTAVHLEGDVYQSENVESPFVLGIIKPKIYIPFGIDDMRLEHVLAHERAHIRRKDHLWKPLGFMILAVYWFSPLAWVGYILLCRDIELACDEKVIKELERDARADYTEALLSCSINRRTIAACPVAFGEAGVKSRIKSALAYKKPALYVIVAAILLCIVFAVCFLTDPPVKNFNTDGNISEENNSLAGVDSDSSDGIKYKVNSDGVSCTLISYNVYSQTHLEIPEKIDEYTVTAIGHNAFKDHTELKYVVIPTYVASIGDSAFEGCNSIKRMVIPAFVKSIGNKAFYNCTSLMSIILPFNIRFIGDEALSGCCSLTDMLYRGSYTLYYKKITLGDNWIHGVPSEKIMCLDGYISLKKQENSDSQHTYKRS